MCFKSIHPWKIGVLDLKQRLRFNFWTFHLIYILSFHLIRISVYYDLLSLSWILIQYLSHLPVIPSHRTSCPILININILNQFLIKRLNRTEKKKKTKLKSLCPGWYKSININSTEYLTLTSYWKEIIKYPQPTNIIQVKWKTGSCQGGYLKTGFI